MVDAIDTAEGDPFIRAGEYALGLLERNELAGARRALLSDHSFADAVEWWENRLGSMGEAAGQFIPSPSVWRGIIARIDAEEQSHSPPPTSFANLKASRWSIAALVGGAGMAVAGLVFFIAAPRPGTLPHQPRVVATPSAQLIAQLQDEESARKLASVIDVADSRLALNISGLEAEAGKTPELWVIPEGGDPVSLGAIPQSGSFDRELSSDEAELLLPGSTLAVTFENDTGQRHETPTMPILLAGTLDRV